MVSILHPVSLRTSCRPQVFFPNPKPDVRLETPWAEGSDFSHLLGPGQCLWSGGQFSEWLSWPRATFQPGSFMKSQSLSIYKACESNDFWREERCHQLLLSERDPEGSAPICPHTCLTLDSTWSVGCNFIASLENRDLFHQPISRVCHVVDMNGLQLCGLVWSTLFLDELGHVLPLLTLETSLGVSWCI